MSIPEHSSEIASTALTGVAQLVECHPTKQKVTGSIPGQGTGLGHGSVPSRGTY